MTKQSIFGRVSQLARANINALIDQAEDPQLMLDQLVRDYTDNIGEAEQAIAQTIGNVRMMEDDYAEDQRAAEEWGRKAVAASQKADEFRSEGNTADASKFDNLARIAIGKQMDAENEAKAALPNLQAQQEVAEKLKIGLAQMRDKLGQLTAKRNELVARAKTAQAQTQVQDAIKSIDVMDPTSEIGRFEDKIKREEARVRGQAELAGNQDAQFESLDDLSEQAEVEARLAALKAGSGGGSAAVSGTPEAPALGAGGSKTTDPGASSSSYGTDSPDRSS